MPNEKLRFFISMSGLFPGAVVVRAVFNGCGGGGAAVAAGMWGAGVRGELVVVGLFGMRALRCYRDRVQESANWSTVKFLPMSWK